MFLHAARTLCLQFNNKLMDLYWLAIYGLLNGRLLCWNHDATLGGTVGPLQPGFLRLICAA